MADPKRFVLDRVEDPTGVSGVGTICWGVEFPDGVVVLRWTREPASVVHYDNGIEAVEAVHGHGGSTVIRWLD